MSDANDIDPVLASSLSGSGRAEHAFFSREGGVSGGIYGSLNTGLGSDDIRADVVENRRRAMAYLQLGEDRLTSVHQIHSNIVARVEEPWEHGNAPRADGLVTNRPGIALGIATADCAPVLFVDEKSGVIGACHAGWKGAITGIVEATVAEMQALGAKLADIRAAVGPCIAQASYEVGADYRERFIETDPDYARFFVPGVSADKFQFDLPGFVCHRLSLSGVGQYEWTGHDTRSDPQRFFSYRRTTLNGEADYGRLLSSVVLRDPI